MPILKTPGRALIILISVALTACVGQETHAPISVTSMDLRDRPILIQNVAVYDSAAMVRIPGQDVLVRGNTIEAVGPTAASIEVEDAHVIAGDGATLLPGLMDMHGHLMTTTGPTWVTASPNPESNLLSYAYAGVTTIFDPGDSSDEAFGRRERVASGELIGPRIYTAGK
ncbi:MAG: hypothetical protein HKN19_16600, partial [Halioglobus sp.]|nr:hypothetical protein [Halioglobus sp.]